MSDWLDFNGDGKVDAGEDFIGYQIYKDVTGPSPTFGSGRSRGKLDGCTVFLIVVIAYAILNTVCDWFY